MGRKTDPLAAFEKVLGRKFTADDLSKMNFPVGGAPDAEKPLPKHMPLAHKLNAEAVLLHLQYPEIPKITKTCKSCGNAFQTSYSMVAYCSSECTRKSMERFGIKWVEQNYRTKSEVELWAGCVPPMVIPPEALAVMKYLVDLAEKNQGFPIQPWQPPLRKQGVVSEPVSVEEKPVSQLDTESILESLQDMPKRVSLEELLKDLD